MHAGVSSFVATELLGVVLITRCTHTRARAHIHRSWATEEKKNSLRVHAWDKIKFDECFQAEFQVAAMREVDADLAQGKSTYFRSAAGAPLLPSQHIITALVQLEQRRGAAGDGCPQEIRVLAETIPGRFLKDVEFGGKSYVFGVVEKYLVTKKMFHLRLYNSRPAVPAAGEKWPRCSRACDMVVQETVEYLNPHLMSEDAVGAEDAVGGGDGEDAAGDRGGEAAEEDGAEEQSEWDDTEEDDDEEKEDHHDEEEQLEQEEQEEQEEQQAAMQLRLRQQTHDEMEGQHIFQQQMQEQQQRAQELALQQAQQLALQHAYMQPQQHQ